ncbi:hypothetical protein ACO0QE_003870 [Hanseniaspora vineae]
MSVQQLKQAKQLALTSKNPEELLPQVLDTTFQLVDVPISGAPPNFELVNFAVDLLQDTLQHSSISKNEHQFIALKHIGKLSQVFQCGFHYYQELELSMINIVSIMALVYEQVFNLVATTSNQELWDLMQLLSLQFKKLWDILTGKGLKYISEFKDDSFLTFNQITMKYRHTRMKVMLMKFFSKIIIIHTMGDSGGTNSNDDNDTNSSGSTNNNSGNLVSSTSSKNTVGQVSLSNVSDSHPVIKNKSKIDSDAKKLLDMLLNYLVDEEIMMCTQVFQCLLTNLVFVMQKRPQSSSRIFQAVLRFNLDRKFQFAKEDTLQYRLSKRFMEREYKNFVNFCYKTQLLNKNMSSLMSKLTKIASTLQMIGDDTKQKGILEYDENSVKNIIPLEILQKFENPKPVVNLVRLRNSALKRPFAEMADTADEEDANKGKYTKDLYSTHKKSFDLTKVSKDNLIKLSINALMDGYKTQPLVTKLLETVLKYTQVSNEVPGVKLQTSDSSISPTPIDAQELQQELPADQLNDTSLLSLVSDISMNKEEGLQHFEFLVNNILSSEGSLDGLNSKKGEEQNDQSLIYKKAAPAVNILIRLASKGIPRENIEYSNIIREKLYEYVIQDFSNRMDYVIAWMNEEWYFESDPLKPVYNEWCNKVFNGIVPFVDNSHRRQFIRLVSELPSMNEQHINNFKSLCLDPLRNQLGFVTLKFMIMFRPPVVSLIKSFLTNLKSEHADLQDQCNNLLSKI